MTRARRLLASLLRRGVWGLVRLESAVAPKPAAVDAAARVIELEAAIEQLSALVDLQLRSTVARTLIMGHSSASLARVDN